MIRSENTIANIIAFFLSKFNERALKYLGYQTYSSAFNELSIVARSKPNYIKLRRDEFDALFPNGPRQGWNKRKPAPSVIDFFNELDKFQFEELSLKVGKLLDIEKSHNDLDMSIKKELSIFSEKDIEDIINFEDDNSALKTINKNTKQRLLNYSIIPKLKKLYNCKCQICGKGPFEDFGVNIVEGHHIENFIESVNNNASNIIVLCPNHHRLMHIAKPKFDREQKIFIYANGLQERLLLNYHL